MGEAQNEQEYLQNKLYCCLVIDSESESSGSRCLTLFKNQFIEITTKLSAFVACRCSPTQKADVALLITNFIKKRVCCVGDCEDDVSISKLRMFVRAPRAPSS